MSVHTNTLSLTWNDDCVKRWILLLSVKYVLPTCAQTFPPDAWWSPTARFHQEKCRSSLLFIKDDAFLTYGCVRDRGWNTTVSVVTTDAVNKVCENDFTSVFYVVSLHCGEVKTRSHQTLSRFNNPSNSERTGRPQHEIWYGWNHNNKWLTTLKYLQNEM